MGISVLQALLVAALFQGVGSGPIEEFANNLDLILRMPGDQFYLEQT